MSSGLGIDYSADHAEMETDRGTSVKFRGRTIAAVVSIPERARDFEDDATGFYRTATLRVSLRDAVTPNSGSIKIKEGETLEYDGDEYRIANTTRDSVSAITLCDCEGVAQ